MKKHIITGLCLVTGLAVFPKSASADLLTFTATGVKPGVSATTNFTLLNATTLRIVLTSTSSSQPAPLASDAAANQLFASLALGLPGTTSILGGTATMSVGSTGRASDIGIEWGFGWDGTGQCCEDTDPRQMYNGWISTRATAPLSNSGRPPRGA